MANFKANNRMKAKELFDHRSIYEGFAFSEAGEINVAPESTKNFWFVENLFYGRIRETSGEISIISPKSSLLRSCRGSSPARPVVALDFVVDAFERLAIEYKKNSIQANRITNDSMHLSQLVAHSGFSNVARSYDKHMARVNKAFLSYAKLNKSEADQIFSFDKFVPFFMEFLTTILNQGMPVTYSSYLVGKRSTPMASGLCIEVAPLDHSNDQNKSELFLNDPNFAIYKTLAASQGFAIDKNAPWRLVADIASSKMLEFAAKRYSGITKSDDVLDYYFEDVRGSRDEFEDFKKMMVSIYNLFVTSNSVVTKRTIGSDGKVRTEFNKRSRELFESATSRIGDDFWYEKFVKTKNIELGLGYSDQEVRKIANNAADLENSLDRSRSTGYIKKRMTPIVSSEGTLAYKVAKLDAGTTASPKKSLQSLAKGLNKKVY
jgi:hypothetical protein